MKVTKVGSGAPVPQAKKAKKSAGKGKLFAESLKEAAGAAEAAEAVDPAAVSAVDAVFAIQEAPDATERRSRGLSVTYGESVLDRLEDIRRDILTGAIPKEKLAILAQTMRAHRNASNDPGLTEIINEIELRSEVEIAKLTRGK